MMGRLTNDPSLIDITKTDGSKTQKVVFSIDVNEEYRKDNGESVEYITHVDCVAWDSGAKLIYKSFVEGSIIIVHGKWINDPGSGGDMVRVKSFGFPMT